YLEQILPTNAVVKLTAVERQPIVILATTEAHCLGDLLIRHYSGELPAVIRAVVSNHEKLKPLVEQFGLPFHYVSHQNLERAAHEDLVAEVLAGYAPEYIVLAKYMRILSPGFVARYPNRMINIHHSFLPAFIGAKPYHQAHERGVKIIGATAHIVTDDLDTGPIIAQGVIPVNHSHTAAAMVQAGRDVEKIVLAKAVKLVLEERFFSRAIERLFSNRFHLCGLGAELVRSESSPDGNLPGEPSAGRRSHSSDRSIDNLTGIR